jgi:hypothetical protein
MMDADEFTADLLSGHRTRIHETQAKGTEPAPPPPVVFDEVRRALDELEALRARDPRAALDVFRSLLSDESLTPMDLDSFIEVWRTAVDNPDEFRARVTPPPIDVVPKGIGSWWDQLRGYLHRPEDPNDEEAAAIEEMRKYYRLPRHKDAPPVNPHERVFETPDPAWVPLLKVKLGEKHWPEDLVPMIRHKALSDFVYPATDLKGQPLAADRAHTIGLVSDFGTGYYHSWGIAEQLTAWGFPYTFHLGDVYYAGRPGEFSRYFELPLFETVTRTQFFGLAENHELYGGGGPYQQFFAQLRQDKRTPQEASYFCVRFPHHQIIGIDVNWQGRQRYADPALVAWLKARLAEADGRTNILLTGSAPFDHGGTDPTQLLKDLWNFVGTGAIGLWFWGDDHYCALFNRHETAVPFYGSCIGHGGFPGDVQPDWKASYKTAPLWVEDHARFPKATGMRQDMTNNGWCQATLRPDGGVDLLYVDWLWCKRMAISFDRDGDGLKHRDPTFIDRDTNPQLHTP